MNILSITGSDPTAGAGIQSDIKTFFMLHIYAFTVVTSITSQNTKQFFKITPIAANMVRNQLDSILSNFVVDSIKVGVVYNSSITKTIYSKLKKQNVLLVLDPILKSTTGGTLLQESAIDVYKKLLIPLSSVITPNVYEASVLANMQIKSKNDLYQCASILNSLGAKNVVITGFKIKNQIVDLIYEDYKYHELFVHEQCNMVHGTGCNYSAALVSYLSMGENLYRSALLAQKFVYNIIKNSKSNNMKIPIIDESNKLISILNKAILKLKQLERFHDLIPECQTNFVFSESNPKSINDVIGISGRIVKSQNNIVVAGGLKYGGSKHVATAIVEIARKFPDLRSAINIKYSDELVKKLKKMDYHILFYDRSKEPPNMKKWGRSIFLGINNAIKYTLKKPDVIFHTGDIGKEPMILIFGRDPFDVIKKINNIL
ncbi:MAG: bifunctional hydroxymethylpyrimidine kinase/phosphomethylpyrimidine kinase [Thaumarchaeota archaeon]|nr:bifunctional hydroxymethylpyrimidine kinase/phosphomethylpyrimidine kinase [Nitrososphaerota archaeon]MCY3975763.1 bifunctional hydroxymethylpyrimidine kinase/phosphomethylpyrimidine kinase [Nitrososphaerota archaeon]